MRKLARFIWFTSANSSATAFGLRINLAFRAAKASFPICSIVFQKA